MSIRKSNTARKNSQPSPVKLTDEETQRLAQKIGVALEHDPEEIGLLLMLFDQLEMAQPSYPEFFNIVLTVKQHLFLGTSASDEARDAFQTEAYRNRGKLLLWPYERKGVSA